MMQHCFSTVLSEDCSTDSNIKHSAPFVSRNLIGISVASMKAPNIKTIQCIVCGCNINMWRIWINAHKNKSHCKNK